MGSYTTVRVGSKGPAVIELQRLLNNNLVPGPRLKTDGDFGSRTYRAVISFQNSKWLTADGIVGKCTWSALRGEEKYAVLHPVNLVPQPTASTCWAASTAMLLGLLRPVTLPAGLTGLMAGDGGLLNDSELQNPVHMATYCNHFNLRMYAPQTYLPEGLYRVLKYKPAMANILWDAASYVAGAGSAGHMIIIAGIRGNGDADGTTLRIYDPWPPALGKIGSAVYSKLLKETPTYTYNLYQRKF